MKQKEETEDLFIRKNLTTRMGGLFKRNPKILNRELSNMRITQAGQLDKHWHV